MSAQNTLMPPPGAGLLNPFSIAAYIAWAVVAFGTLWRIDYQGVPRPAELLGLAASFVVLLLFALRAHLDAQNVPTRTKQPLILAQLAAALLACWTFAGDAMQPTLLVIAASQVAIAFSLPLTLAILGSANALLGLVLVEHWGVGRGLQLVSAFASFQAFAAIGVVYATKLVHSHNAWIRMNAELIATRHLLEEGARAAERLRLSRELHDIAGHKLTALKMQLAVQSRTLPPEAAQALGESARLANELLGDIRSVVSTIRQHEGIDLQRALASLKLSAPHMNLVFELDPTARVPDIRCALTLLRCAQEGLTNIMRHSGASTAQVSLRRTDQGIELAVRDDGVGRASSIGLGNGLRGLKERLDEVGGTIEIDDHQGSGIVLRAILPDMRSVA